MNTHVNFETAKLLKQKGFNLYCVWSYWKDELTPHTPEYALEDGTTSQENYWDFERYYAPTIAEVVMWLYEKHEIWIDVSLSQFSKPKDLQWMYSIVFTQRCTYSHSPKSYNSPTEAYEAAILYTLNKLI